MVRGCVFFNMNIECMCIDINNMLGDCIKIIYDLNESRLI